ncbi:methyltransferase [Sphaerisporangium krabiense]|uniref:Phospholipid N-methyltransferase n=1 Tax=Sphaerisporangium krabiense TaxID=763782 RepID=A0A7W9DUR9_9ACTN|nr:methyltransferase domain-containing protein [Sphaerisporangium krabiense]MBB5631329.1 phospholipid N-methyltransferase [Sphaerisporangium krabiense]GII60746.1 methyltransferase [Sphaerisporangium krabiense]
MADDVEDANDTALFFRQFVRSPATTGAVAPSSLRLARVVSAPVPERGDPVIVELGPGTGVFTGEIQRRLAGRGHHLAVEINPLLATRLARRHPGATVVVADAADLPRLLAEHGLDHADAVVSGLPWAAFPGALQDRLLGAISDVLVKGGAFTTFAYVHARALPPALRFRRRLLETFEEVVAGRTVWANLPPAFVYHARRPRA